MNTLQYKIIDLNANEENGKLPASCRHLVCVQSYVAFIAWNPELCNSLKAEEPGDIQANQVGNDLQD